MRSIHSSGRVTRIYPASPVMHYHLIYRDYTLVVTLVTIALWAVLRISASMKTIATPNAVIAINGERGAQWTIDSASSRVSGWIG